MDYGYKRQVPMPYEAAVEKVREELKKEGFGILTEIDVKATLKKKLDVDFEKYIILGACNPPLAYRALQEEMNLGLLLPCNVVVYEEGGRTVVAAIDAERMLSVANNPQLESVAREVNAKLRQVVDGVSHA